MSAELGKEHKEYRCLDERVRNFLSCQMPEEAMRYEDDIYVSFFGLTNSPAIYLFSVLRRFSGINVYHSNTSRRLTGRR